jgi:formiminotetrahydrofolate cyclodeaminase
MTNELPKFTDEEKLASTEAHAAHWENEARYSPADVAFHCRDYAAHLRTIAECLRMDMLDREVKIRD